MSFLQLVVEDLYQLNLRMFLHISQRSGAFSYEEIDFPRACSTIKSHGLDGFPELRTIHQSHFSGFTELQTI